MANKAQAILDAIADGQYDHILNQDHDDDYVYAALGGPYTLRSDTQPNTVTFQCGEDEMLKFSDKGFWVRGVKVEQDDKEAQSVYNAFKQWLVWQQLNGR
jgi:hypothetical protein